MFEKRNGCIDYLLRFFGLIFLVTLFFGDSDNEDQNTGMKFALGMLVILCCFRNWND